MAGGRPVARAWEPEIPPGEESEAAGGREDDGRGRAGKNGWGRGPPNRQAGGERRDELALAPAGGGSARRPGARDGAGSLKPNEG